MNIKQPNAIMAERRAAVWARLEAHRAAKADRRRARWLRACRACYVVAGLSMVAAGALGIALPGSLAAGYAFAVLVLSLLGAEIAAERAVR